MVTWFGPIVSDSRGLVFYARHINLGPSGLDEPREPRTHQPQPERLGGCSPVGGEESRCKRFGAWGKIALRGVDKIPAN